MIGRGKPILVQALIVAVETEVKIEPAVAIIIGSGNGSKCSLGRLCKRKRIGLQTKGSILLIEEEQRSFGTDDQQILVTIIVQVGEERAGSRIEDRNPGHFGDIFKCSIPSIAVKPVREARRLADIKVVKAIIVKVTYGNAIVAVDINPTGAV